MASSSSSSFSKSSVSIQYTTANKTASLDTKKASVVDSGRKAIYTSKMPNRNRVINKLALVLISIVVLELVLIGDQVQPVKAIKKKIYLKKLKKLLPLFALVKPKKKIILVPIPIPMFKSHSSSQSSNHHHQTSAHPGMTVPGHHQHHHGGYSSPMSQAPLPSFVVMDNDMRPQHGFMNFPMGDSMQISMPSSNNDVESIIGGGEPVGASIPAAAASNASAPPSSPMGSMQLGPSMTMTIQSKPDGGSNIELSTNINAAPSGESGALLQMPYGTKFSRPQSPAKQVRHQQQLPAQLTQQLQLHLNHNDHFAGDDFSAPAGGGEQAPGGEHYYSSPWSSNRSPPLASSAAKMLRLPSSSKQYQQQSNWLPARPLPDTQWRPQLQPIRYQQPQMISQQQLNQALELEELIPAGPPPQATQPVYRAPIGQMHAPLRQPPRVEQEQEIMREPQNDELGDEVQTLGRPDVNAAGHNQPGNPRPPASGQLLQHTGPPANQRLPILVGKTTSGQSGRLISPAIKGKQQQSSQQQQGTKQKVAAGGY